MGTNFTTSVNIIRDKGRDLSYFPTPNALRVVNQISNDFKKGIRSFNIIGSYGTGKSAFLWAFQESLTSKKKYFTVNLLPSAKIDFINIVGEFRSFKDAIAESLDLSKSKSSVDNIFSELYNKYHDLGTKNPILFLLVDEFGKFLEYASQNSPEKELYFIQQFAEFVNNPNANIVFITTVHQNFDAYAFSLNQSQKQEWTKVKGRFREITFNEPVEQLLFLAAEHINERFVVRKETSTIKSIVDLLIKSKAFNVTLDYINDISEKLFPLDSLSAYILTLSLQKYGQNERSLFTFLESTDQTGLSEHVKGKEGFFNIADVYDYLIFNYYSYLNSRYNPDYAAWRSIATALEKSENVFPNSIYEYSQIIKTIGLLSINAQAGAIIDKSFLVNYSEKCLNIKNASWLIEDLEKRKIILFRNYSKKFVLFEGTDLDIQTALIEAGGKVEDVRDIVTLLNKSYQSPPVIAKRIMYKTGTPRLFEYRITSYPINENPVGEVDGFINLIFNEKNILNEIIQSSSENDDAILYCFYKNSKAIKDILFEIEKTKQVISENTDDKVAVRELNNILLHQQNLLTHKIANNYTSSKAEVVWVFKGDFVSIKNKKDFNSQLSVICESVYSKTPIFNNELVNKHKISASIHSAKRNYFKALVANWDKPQLDFPADKYPPEKTIYLTLLENNNIKIFTDSLSQDFKPSNKNKFNDLWKLSESFLDSAKSSKRKVSDFVELLSRRPFKLKQGLVDFWVPTFLFIKRNDFGLFGEKGFLPVINDEILELLVKNPEKFEVKTYAIEGVKLDLFNSYRIFLNQTTKEDLTNASFIETIKPFLTFYKGLPEYSKNTKRISKEAIEIRNAIITSKDPESTFFEDFPNALGYSVASIQSSPKKLQEFVLHLQSAIKELRSSYDELINRVDDFIKSDIVGEDVEFETYKDILQNRFKKLRRHLLLPNQRIFIQRLDSKIEDKKAWLNSLVQALTNVTLEKIKDEEEVLIYDKFKAMILDLDSLTDLSKSDFNEDKEDVFDLQINSFSEGIEKRMVRVPKNKIDDVNKIKKELKKNLSKDSTLNIAALTNLIKEIMKNE